MIYNNLILIIYNSRYGCPRVGNQAFADFFNNEKNIHVTRVVHQAENGMQIFTLFPTK